MAKSIKTKFYANATATCSNCGSVYNIGSNKETLSLEICGNCHPFYTGNESVIDATGRIDRFMNRMNVTVTEKKEKVRKNRKQLLSLDDLNDENAETVATPLVKVEKKVETVVAEEASKIETSSEEVAE